MKNCEYSKNEKPIKLSAIMLLVVRFFQFFGLLANSFQLYNQRTVPTFSSGKLLIWIRCQVCFNGILFVVTFINRNKFLYSIDNFGKYNDLMKLFDTNIVCYIVFAETLLCRREIQKFFRIYCGLHCNWANIKTMQEAQIYNSFLLYACTFVLGMVCLDFAYFHKVCLALYRTGNVQPFYQFLLITPSLAICRLRLIQIMLYMELIRIEVQELNRNIVRIKMTNYLESDFLNLIYTYQQIHEMFTTFERSTKFSLIATYTNAYIRMLADWYWYFLLLHNGTDITGWYT